MISAVIPVYNEAENIEKMYERLNKAAQTWNEEIEMLFVDDGSHDGSLEMIKRLRQKDSRVKAVSFSRNFGHQAAVSAGLQHANGTAVIVMDGDLQDRPEELEQFIAKWREGYQVVYAIRQMRKDEGFIKRWASMAFYRVFSKITNIKVPLDSGDFCLMDRIVVDQLNLMPERNRFIRGLRAWVGFRQIGVPVYRDRRSKGSAKYTFFKSLRLARDAIVSFSYVPLHYVGALGLSIAFLSLLLMLFVVIHRISGFKILGYSPQDWPGYASLMLAILFFGGIQLFALGVVGEYISRILDETKARPLFIAKEYVGLSTKHGDQ